MESSFLRQIDDFSNSRVLLHSLDKLMVLRILEFYNSFNHMTLTVYPFQFLQKQNSSWTPRSEPVPTRVVRRRGDQAGGSRQGKYIVAIGAHAEPSNINNQSDSSTCMNGTGGSLSQYFKRLGAIHRANESREPNAGATP